MMDRSFRRKILATATMTALLAAWSGTAASAAEGDNKSAGEGSPAYRGVEEIIVTAQKREERINDVGMSITALTGDSLLERGINGPEDLAEGVVGLTYSRLPSGPPVFSIRGIGFPEVITAGAPGVSTYLDEVPLPYSIMALGAALDVQRVEVLKGPQGTLFGQNVTGGAINFIANRPTDEFSAGLNISYGSYDKLNASGHVSFPLADTLKARFAVGIDHIGDWQRSTTRDDTRGESSLFMARFLLDWEPTDRMTLQFNANGWKDESEEPGAQLIGVSSPFSPIAGQLARYPMPSNARQADWTPDLPLGARDPVTGAVNNRFGRDNDFVQLSLRGDYELNDAVTLTSITAWQKLNQQSLADVDGTDLNNWNTGSGTRIKAFSQELRLTGTSGRLDWVLGANYMRERITGSASVFSAIGFFPFSATASVGHTKSETYAAFAHLEYHLTDALSVIGGIRYTDVNIHNEACTYDGGDGRYAGLVTGIAASRGVFIAVPPGGCVTLDPVTYRPGIVTRDLDQDNIPFKLGLNFKVTPSSLLYANVSRGYKTGGFTLSGATFAPGFDPATQESVLAYEAGFKLGLADNRVQVNGAAFHYDYDDKQVRGRYIDPVVGPLNRLINIPKSRVTGAELQLNWAPDRHWRFSAGGTYTDSRIVGSFPNLDALGQPTDLGGSVLPYTPKWLLIGDAEFTAPVSSRLSAFIGGHARYQSDSFSGLGENAILQTDGYANFDLRLGIREDSGRWSLSFFADNVTNKYSWRAATLSGTDAIARTANLPRIIGVRLGFRH